MLQTVPNWLNEAEGTWGPWPQLECPRACSILSHQGTQLSLSFLLGCSQQSSVFLCASVSPHRRAFLALTVLWPAGSSFTWLPD